MTTTAINLSVKGLGKRRMAELASKARLAGLSPERYARQLIERGLALEHEARTKTFDELMAPVRKRARHVDDDEIDALVDQARHRHHQRATRSKR